MGVLDTGEYFPIPVTDSIGLAAGLTFLGVAHLGPSSQFSAPGFPFIVLEFPIYFPPEGSSGEPEFAGLLDVFYDAQTGQIKDPVIFDGSGVPLFQITPQAGSAVASLISSSSFYSSFWTLYDGNVTLSIQASPTQQNIEVGAGGAASIGGGSNAVVWIWHDKSIVWTTTGSNNALVFDAEAAAIGAQNSTPGVLFLNLITGAGTNPWGGTLSFQGVNQVAVGILGGEYIVCNNSGDTINSGFENLQEGGNTLVVGGTGSDTLSGSNSNLASITNVIVAGSGTSTLSGGQIFGGGPVSNVFSYNHGTDTITNFRVGANSGDVIDLSAVSGLASFSDVQKLISQVGSNTLITFAPGQTVTLDKVTGSALTASNFIFAPEAAFAFAQTGEVDAGGTVKIYLAMTGAVAVNTSSGSPTLTLSDGAIATYDAAASSTAGHVIVFDYTVGASDHSPDLAINSFSANGAVIQDASGHGVNFSPIASQSLGVQINPSLFYVSSIKASVASGTEIDAGGSVTITLNMSESSFTIGALNHPYLLLSDGQTAAYAGSNVNQISFTYTVGSFDHTPDLQIVAVEQGAANNPQPAIITDNAGYAANLSNATNASLGIEIGPTLYVQSLGPDAPSNPGIGWLEANAGSTVHLTLTMNEGVTVTGSPTLALNDGASATYDAVLSKPGSGVLVFDYTVGAKDSTPGLLVNSVSGGTIVDANKVAANFTNIDLFTTGLQINSSPLTAMHLSESTTGHVSIAHTVMLTLQMSEGFTVTRPDLLQLNLNDGEQAFYDAANSNPATGLLVFDYFVGSETKDPRASNLEITGITGLSPGIKAQGQIQDGKGFNADISAVLNMPTGIQVGPALFIASISTPWTSPEAVAGQTVQIDVKLSEGATVNTAAGAPSLTLNDGATATFDSAASNLAAGQLVFDYKVGANDSTPFLIVQSFNRNGAGIADSSQNPLDTTLPANPTTLTPLGSNWPLQIGPATVDSVDASQVGKIQPGQTLKIEINTDDFMNLNTAGGSPTLTLNNGAIATLDLQIGNQFPSSLVFDYTVGTNDATSNLAITGVNLNGATVTDLAGYNVNFSAALNQPLNIQVAGGSSTGNPIDEVFQAVLQRGPSGAETAAGTSLNTTIGTFGAIAAIIDSPEAQHNVYPIAQIVQLATGSMPTTGQLAGWVPFVESQGLLQGSAQTNPLLDQMAEAFVASTAFGNTYNSGTAVDPNAPITGPIVSAIIKAATGLSAAQAQINAWLSTGQTIDQVFVDFALGDQYSAFIQSAVQHYLTTVADNAIGGGGLGVVNATPNDNLTATQVQGAYHAVLQRVPTSAEVNGALSIDGTIGNIGAVAALVDGTEAQQYVYPVTQVILLATGNFATGGQLAGWVPAVETGTSLDTMALAFVASSAFGNTYNNGTVVDPNAPITAGIVSAIIHAATGIAATQTQINAWLATGETIDQVFVSFALGDQYSAHIQSTVQAYLDATAINAAGLTTVDGVNATGALTLGTAATPLIGNNLTILGGSGSLSVMASGNNDTITELNSSTAGGAITASGSNDVIILANGPTTLTLTGDLTGATTQNGTSTSGIAMTTLGNLLNAASDQIILNNATMEVLAGTTAVNVTAAGSSLAKALDIAANYAAASQAGGQIAAHTGVIAWFQLGGNTYIVEAINSTATAAAHGSLAVTDEVIKIVGLVDLSGEVLLNHMLTL